jgi:hypothetical protein
MHELGHALGLGHSADANSVMYATLQTCLARRNLSVADLAIPDVCSGPCGLHVNGWGGSGPGHPPGCGCPACAGAAGLASVAPGRSATPVAVSPNLGVPAPNAAMPPWDAPAGQTMPVAAASVTLQGVDSGLLVSATPRAVPSASVITLPEIASAAPPFGAQSRDGWHQGAGDQVLVGGDGDSLQIGGAGRDYLIGGIGSASNETRSADNWSSAAYTDLNLHDTGLAATLTEWTCCNIMHSDAILDSPL